MELEEVNWRLQVVMVPRREVSERVSRQREEKGAPEAGRMLELPPAQDALYAPREGGALPNADSWFPSRFRHSGPVQLPTPAYSAQGQLASLCAAQSSHPALGAWVPEKTHKPSRS